MLERIASGSANAAAFEQREREAQRVTGCDGLLVRRERRVQEVARERLGADEVAAEDPGAGQRLLQADFGGDAQLRVGLEKGEPGVRDRVGPFVVTGPARGTGFGDRGVEVDARVVGAFPHLGRGGDRRREIDVREMRRAVGRERVAPHRIDDGRQRLVDHGERGRHVVTVEDQPGRVRERHVGPLRVGGGGLRQFPEEPLAVDLMGSVHGLRGDEARPELGLRLHRCALQEPDELGRERVACGARETDEEIGIDGTAGVELPAGDVRQVLVAQIAVAADDVEEAGRDAAPVERGDRRRDDRGVHRMRETDVGVAVVRDDGDEGPALELAQCVDALEPFEGAERDLAADREHACKLLLGLVAEREARLDALAQPTRGPDRSGDREAVWAGHERTVGERSEHELADVAREPVGEPLHHTARAVVERSARERGRERRGRVHIERFELDPGGDVGTPQLHEGRWGEVVRVDDRDDRRSRPREPQHEGRGEIVEVLAVVDDEPAVADRLQVVVLDLVEVRGRGRDAAGGAGREGAEGDGGERGGPDDPFGGRRLGGGDQPADQARRSHAAPAGDDHAAVLGELAEQPPDDGFPADHPWGVHRTSLRITYRRK